MNTTPSVARKICFAVPGSKHYETADYLNTQDSFANISITGTVCHCRCEHCRGKLLETMLPAATLQEFYTQIDILAAKGCRGILISGGSDENGEVPLAPFAPGIVYARQKGLKVLVHSGIISKDTAAALKQAGIDQVLLDIIGDESTIRDIYHLKNSPEDYYEAMKNCYEAGLDFVPHVVVGLNKGKISGEYRALEMIKKANPSVVVIVVLKPMRGTPMEDISPPAINEVACLFKHARELFQRSILTLGCAKPAGRYKEELEKIAVDYHADVIAFPSEKTIEYARAQGLDILFKEECCSSCCQ